MNYIPLIDSKPLIDRQSASISQRLISEQSINFDLQEESKWTELPEALMSKAKIMQSLALKNFIDVTVSEPLYKYEVDTHVSSSWIKLGTFIKIHTTKSL